MKIFETQKKLCMQCMEEHVVQVISDDLTEEYKGIEVTYHAYFEYCDNTDELLETEEMMRANALAMRDAYRERLGLLTSAEIIKIREKYRVSQKDFSEILGWGGATITRYENFQVQDRIHDDMLRKLDADPRWFLDLLERAEGKIPERAYAKCLSAANSEYRKMQNSYLESSISALYANHVDASETGGVTMDLARVVEIINYFASKTNNLFMVKLMKMLWYGDALSFKRRGKAISGLVYQALPMGAVPIGYREIIALDSIESEDIVFPDGNVGTKFSARELSETSEVSDIYEVSDTRLLIEQDLEILDDVIKEVGSLDSKNIVEKMHDEVAYRSTEPAGIISFSYADQLSID